MLSKRVEMEAVDPVTLSICYLRAAQSRPRSVSVGSTVDCSPGAVASMLPAAWRRLAAHDVMMLLISAACQIKAACRGTWPIWPLRTTAFVFLCLFVVFLLSGFNLRQHAMPEPRPADFCRQIVSGAKAIPPDAYQSKKMSVVTLPWGP